MRRGKTRTLEVTMLSWLRKDKKPEVASEKIKPLMLEVCRRIEEDWASGGYLAVDQLEGRSVPVLSFVTSRAGYELLLGDEYSVLLKVTDGQANLADAQEVARYTDITRMSILKYSK
jgi:hypothetical protein